MLPYKLQKLIRYSALLIPTLLLSFINIGTILGDSIDHDSYFTPTRSNPEQMILDEYAQQSVYLIDLQGFGFIPNSIQIWKKNTLLQEEELAEEEYPMIYEIDLKQKPEGIYKIKVSDKEGHSSEETITHKTT